MASFNQNTKRRFRISDDILLLDEVKSRNPFAAVNKGKAWSDIATALNGLKLFKVSLDDRAVEDRTMNLLKIFRSEDVKNRIKSGTEEQYGQVEALLADIDGLVKDTENVKVAKKRAQDEKADELMKSSKVVKNAGEEGRSVIRNRSEESESGESDDAIARAEYLATNGGDQRDWVEEKQHRKKSKSDATANEDGIKQKNKRRKSRHPVRKTEDQMWMELLKEQDEKKYQFKEKVHQDNTALRVKELEVEKLRAEADLLKWKYLLSNKTYSQIFWIEVDKVLFSTRIIPSVILLYVLE